jgi:hypothetical protein
VGGKDKYTGKGIEGILRETAQGENRSGAGEGGGGIRFGGGGERESAQGTAMGGRVGELSNLWQSFMAPHSFIAII